MATIYDPEFPPPEDIVRWFVHGVSYIDERLMMMNLNDPEEENDDRPFYFTLDRQYNVRGVVDRAGSLREVYRYDEYGRILRRECRGRGDMDHDGDMAPSSRSTSRASTPPRMAPSGTRGPTWMMTATSMRRTTRCAARSAGAPPCASTMGARVPHAIPDDGWPSVYSRWVRDDRSAEQPYELRKHSPVT